jgi:hypothetical protein
MRRIATLLVVVALGVLAALAVADSLRSDASSRAGPSPETTTKAKPPTLPDMLRTEAVTGYVLYSDRDCRMHSLLLPRMIDRVIRDEGGADVFHCHFTVAAGQIVDGEDVPSPGGGALARCRGDHIAVWKTVSGATLRTFRGCSPAWDADGRLTYFNGDAIVQDNGQVLYSQAKLRGIARRHPNVAGLGADVPIRVSVLALAWLDRLRLAMSLRIDIRGVESQYLVALVDGGDILAIDDVFGSAVTRFVASPGSTYVGEREGVLSRGRSFDFPQELSQPRALTFSPDDRWIALFNRESVYIVGLPNFDPIIQLPIYARTFVWEPVNSGTAYGPPIRR